MLAEIRLDYTNIDLSLFKSKIRNGQHIYLVPSKVTVEFGHRRGVLVFKCYVGTKDIGNAEILFDGQSTTDVSESFGSLDHSGSGAHAPGCGVQ